MRGKEVYHQSTLFSLTCLQSGQEAEDHAGRRHRFYVYQHAFQGDGSQHPTRYQGAVGAHAGCWPQVGQNGLTWLTLFFKPSRSLHMYAAFSPFKSDIELFVL